MVSLFVVMMMMLWRVDWDMDGGWDFLVDWEFHFFVVDVRTIDWNFHFIR